MQSTWQYNTECRPPCNYLGETHCACLHAKKSIHKHAHSEIGSAQIIDHCVVPFKTGPAKSNAQVYITVVTPEFGLMPSVFG